MHTTLWWTLVILIFLVVVAQLRPSTSTPKHCMTCGIEGTPANKSKGSLGMEAVLWLCFIVPGVIYGFWRRSADNPSCAACGSKTLVPIDSPAAVSHRKALQQ